MPISFKEIQGYTLDAIDGEIGKVTDVLFDDSNWNVRYAEAGTGSWLPGRRVILYSRALGEPDTEEKRFRVHLAIDQIRNGPHVDTQRTVSRQKEIELFQYYQWEPYWGYAAPDYFPAFEPEAVGQGSKPVMPGGGENHLRSMNEVCGYKIAAVDGEFGEVEDFLMDGPDWRVWGVQISTRRWLPGTSVTLPVCSVRGIVWNDQTIITTMSKEYIRDLREGETADGGV